MQINCPNSPMSRPAGQGWQWLCAGALVLLRPNAYFAIGAVDIADDFSHGWDANVASKGILDADDRCGDGRFHFRALKGQIRAVHRTIHQPQALAIAE